jgi:hypothetical protein
MNRDLELESGHNFVLESFSVILLGCINCWGYVTSSEVWGTAIVLSLHLVDQKTTEEPQHQEIPTGIQTDTS